MTTTPYTIPTTGITTAPRQDERGYGMYIHSDGRVTVYAPDGWRVGRYASISTAQRAIDRCVRQAEGV
jgi:hypothetical protein